MIPTAFLQAWSVKAPWSDLRQVEQDLIICRAMCDLFNAPALAGKLAFRGGTAIHKLLFSQALRYSEDIDLVQTQPEPIGGTVDAIRAALSWLGRCNREQAGHSMHLVFKFRPEIDTQATLKLKVEINTREHGNLLGVRRYPFAVDSGWYRGATEIVSFEPEELFGTKLRAMLQRRFVSVSSPVSFRCSPPAAVAVAAAVVARPTRPSRTRRRADVLRDRGDQLHAGARLLTGRLRQRAIRVDLADLQPDLQPGRCALAYRRELAGRGDRPDHQRQWRRCGVLSGGGDQLCHQRPSVDHQHRVQCVLGDLHVLELPLPVQPAEQHDGHRTRVRR
jgi:hypothetical protein